MTDKALEDYILEHGGDAQTW